MKTTLKQIAEDTGLSISTVSRVVTGRGYVSQDSIDLVNDAIKRLDYVHGRPQAQISRGQDDLVMILVGGVRSSLASELVETLSLELRKRRKRPMVAITAFSPEAERSYLQFAAENHFYGIIALTITETPETLAMLRAYSCPIVMVERYLPSLDIDSLRSDCYRMGFLGAEYLYKCGHRHIGFIGGGLESTITQDKRMGFEDCMNAYGLELRPEWIIHTDRLIFENGPKVTQQLLQLDKLPTALVTSNDISISILNELMSNGIRVPEDISLILCEDISMAQHCMVPLTAMKVDFRHMAADAVKMLLNRRRHASAPRKQLVYTPQLIERSSVISLHK